MATVMIKHRDEREVTRRKLLIERNEKNGSLAVTLSLSPSLSL